MKKFIFKIIISIIFIVPCILFSNTTNRNFVKHCYESIKYDTFNVFHWNRIRFTSAEPNKNFVKTRYIVKNPKKFNAFIFGSSRVGVLLPDYLPTKLNDRDLKWYNMTYSEGIPKEHYETIKTFLKNKVDIKMILIGFDDISMYATMENHQMQLLRCPYQVYENNKWAFYKPYLELETSDTIKSQINNYKYTNVVLEREKEFYKFQANSYDISIPEKVDLDRYKAGFVKYTQKDSYKDLEDIVNLCKANNIKLILFTNPIYSSLYKQRVEAGYLDFLRNVGTNCEFYNFSCLNNYSLNPCYYFESSHYRPFLGLKVEKVLFGSDEERKKIQKEAALNKDEEDLFGILINSENVEDVIKRLREQIND